MRNFFSRFWWALLMCPGAVATFVHRLRRQKDHQHRQLPSETIAPEPIVANVGPLALLAYARHFFSAAQSLPANGDRVSPVAYYLFCHSIELALKAFLRTKGVPVQDLRSQRRFGHDLERLLDRGIDLGLLTVAHLSRDQQLAIQVASESYRSKRFEYLEDALGLFETLTGYASQPNLATLRSAAEVLVAGIKEPCRQAI